MTRGIFPKKWSRITACLLILVFNLQQAGFAQTMHVLDLAPHINRQNPGISRVEAFRPVHLRALSFDQALNKFELVMDTGTLAKAPANEIRQETDASFRYFLTGISLPNETFWVNLRPDAPGQIIDGKFAQTDAGRIMLAADLELKKDTARALSAQTEQGREFWKKIYSKAEELFGTAQTQIPTLVRPWIVPDEVILRQSSDNVYVYKATLKVMLEQDHLQNDQLYAFKDVRLRKLNDYAAELARREIIPQLTLEVNRSHKYAQLRQVYYSFIMAQWFKRAFNADSSEYSRRIDSYDLSGIASKQPWSVQEYFQAYKESFQNGEFTAAYKENTVQGVMLRKYVSGGATLANIVPTLIVAPRNNLDPSGSAFAPGMPRFDAGTGKSQSSSSVVAGVLIGGGTRVRFGMVDRNGPVGELLQEDWPQDASVSPSEGRRRSISAGIDLITRAIGANREIEKVTISWAGPGDYTRGLVRGTNIYGFRLPDLKNDPDLYVRDGGWYDLNNALKDEAARRGISIGSIDIVHDGAASAKGEYQLTHPSEKAPDPVYGAFNHNRGIAVKVGVGEVGHSFKARPNAEESATIIDRSGEDGTDFPANESGEHDVEQWLGGPVIAQRYAQMMIDKGFSAAELFGISEEQVRTFVSLSAHGLEVSDAPVGEGIYRVLAENYRNNEANTVEFVGRVADEVGAFLGSVRSAYPRGYYISVILGTGIGAGFLELPEAQLPTQIVIVGGTAENLAKPRESGQVDSFMERVSALAGVKVLRSQGNAQRDLYAGVPSAGSSALEAARPVAVMPRVWTPGNEISGPVGVLEPVEIAYPHHGEAEFAIVDASGQVKHVLERVPLREKNGSFITSLIYPFNAFRLAGEEKWQVIQRNEGFIPAAGAERSAGVLMHITSLAGTQDSERGTFGREAYRFVDWLAAIGARYWQVLPLGPTDEYGSPYTSYALDAINPNFMDTRGLSGSQEEEFSRARGEPGYQEFLRQEASWLDNYALFLALKERFADKPWYEWADQALLNHDAQAVRDMQNEPAFAARVEYYKAREYVLEKQWMALKSYANSKGIKIIGDLPIYCSLDSSDVWSHPGLFKLGADHKPQAVAGVPPDYFSATGQMWGNPVYRWDAHQKDGFQWWRNRFDRAQRRYDLLRVDHFRGFQAYGELPADAQNGLDCKWVPGPGADLFRAVENDSRFPNGLGFIIAENLGIITPDVEELRKEFRLPGMGVGQFAFGGDMASVHLPFNQEEDTVNYQGTHDNPTTKAWYQEVRANHAVVEQLKAFVSGGQELSEETIVSEMIRWDMGSRAGLSVVTMQDVWRLGPEGNMNRPGIAGGNWQYVSRPVNEIPGELNQFISGVIAQSGRSSRQAASSVVKQNIAPGGIDFRVIPLPNAAMNLTAIAGFESAEEMERSIGAVDPVESWNHIESMMNAEVTPAAEELAIYLLARGKQGVFRQKQLNDVLSAVACSLRLQELRDEVASEKLKALLVYLESGKTLDEFRRELHLVSSQWNHAPETAAGYKRED